MIAIASAPAIAQNLECLEEFFRVARHHDNCQNFRICMIGRHVDFFCDEGYIFDEDRIQCRAGYPETCEYAIEIEPLNV